MKIKLIAVGTKMPNWVLRGIAEYQKRLPRDMSLEIIEIPLGYRPKQGGIAKAIAQEERVMLAAIDKNAYVVALDVAGKSWSTEQLAQQYEQWQRLGQSVCLLVGGPDGLGPQCLAKADSRWSLSGLTLPHPLVRIVLAEQLYRAWSLLNNHPYHK